MELGIRKLRGKLTASGLVVGVVAALVGGGGQPANATVEWSSSVQASDGTTYTGTNHLTRDAFGRGARSWLIVWTGPIDTTGPDFLAVIDTTKGRSSYGKVVNTVTIDPARASEPHHMQYVWHKGDHIYAGGLFGDNTFVFDASRLPALSLTGVNIAADTPCGTVPDAYQVLSDGTAYGTYMGGPNVPGPCTYSNGEVRVGNGFGGTPGAIVRIGKDGRTLAEVPAMKAGGEDPEQCGSVPALPQASCANPHGIALREDLNVIVASDFAEARNFLTPLPPLTDNLFRETVRVFDITDRNNPKLKSVSRLKTGPRAALENDGSWHESRVVMETATTNLPNHKGAFAETMNGGALHYTADVTAAQPVWQEIFDDTTAYRRFQPDRSVTGGGDNASWIAVSPDDRFLFHAVMGQATAYGQPLDKTTGMLYVLDIRKLLAAGTGVKCTIDELSEVFTGGKEKDCPELVDVQPIRDVSTGGPHWGAMDNFARGWDGKYHETKTISRVATSNYFVLNSLGGDGDHRVCMINVSPSGKLSLDTRFRDEFNGRSCVDFHRELWPHGAFGFARPHAILFAASDRGLR